MVGAIKFKGFFYVTFEKKKKRQRERERVGKGIFIGFQTLVVAHIVYRFAWLDHILLIWTLIHIFCGCAYRVCTEGISFSCVLNLCVEKRDEALYSFFFLLGDCGG